MNAILYALENVDTVSYNRWTADCPICNRRVVVQIDGDSHTTVHCDKCAEADIYLALGLETTDRTPRGAKPKRWPRRWWTIPPRYGSGSR
ncbi:conserved hypothetical protein [Cupriavidus taiwanensis]|uniref:Uncharacterized protein n=1 Tax=Cupriavidus taiwanensis TaxID=164546 RepID=A0A976ATA8_9BURK|nr:hypothetical protein [Cupriavidus taiwanensis]SOZ49339.1 conserved hypothetical protein [Cupriavidus taiwanensis]SOZ49406.1 conserved hypothetical protein [Cupriavidus taiwanensis]SOZ52005.1 conserved hypothetical protein [Cupriavidus taiwanensis]SPA07169.1 conserved hypothetical protein [Cupriavidus taiwanensis]